MEPLTKGNRRRVPSKRAAGASPKQPKITSRGSMLKEIDGEYNYLI